MSQDNLPSQDAFMAWLESKCSNSVESFFSKMSASLPSQGLPPVPSGTTNIPSEPDSDKSEGEASGSKRPWKGSSISAGKGKAPAKRTKTAGTPVNDPLSIVDEWRADSSNGSEFSVNLASSREIDSGFVREYLVDEPHLAEPQQSHTASTSTDLPVLDPTGSSLFDPTTMRHPRATEWAPPEHIALYIHKWLRKSLPKEVRNKLRAECPRPSIPDKVALTPEFDPNVVALLSVNKKDPRRGLEQGLKSAQDKLLDLVGPVTQILSLADRAFLHDTPLDSKTIRDWALRVVCLLGNANVAIATERRKAVLLRMDPRLAELGTKDLGAAANGLLFGDAFVKELNRHVSLMTSWNKAKTSMKRVFQPNLHFSGRAGRPRGRAASRSAPQGPRNFPPPQSSYRPAYHQRSIIPRGSYRGRGAQGFPRGRSSFA